MSLTGCCRSSSPGPNDVTLVTRVARGSRTRCPGRHGTRGRGRTEKEREKGDGRAISRWRKWDGRHSNVIRGKTYPRISWYEARGGRKRSEIAKLRSRQSERYRNNAPEAWRGAYTIFRGEQSHDYGPFQRRSVMYICRGSFETSRRLESILYIVSIDRKYTLYSYGSAYVVGNYLL